MFLLSACFGKQQSRSLAVCAGIFLALGNAWLLPAARAQQAKAPGASALPQAQLTLHVALVKSDVSVTDKHGKFVAGLKKKNFRVFDDGIERPITFFASTEAPAQILVLVEASPAVFFIHRQHLDAAYALLDGLRPDDRVALAAYAERARLVLPLTSNKAALTEGLSTLEYTLGSSQLNFYDAVSACLDWLGQIPGKKALVILSTGLDSSPPGHWEALEQKVKGSSVTIFPVALGGSFRSYRGGSPQAANDAGSAPVRLPGLSFVAANRALRSLAERSGGEAFFPKKDKEFVGIYQRIATVLRHEYALGFAPSVRDGKFHSLRIEVLNSRGRLVSASGSKKGYHVFARQGYEAPKPSN